MAKAKKVVKLVGESEKRLDSYLEKEGEVEQKSIRASSLLWSRVEDLAELKGVSMNQLVCAMMAKACDEEGMA